ADGAPWTGRSDGGTCTEVVDVVLALDVSSSMGFVLDDLERDIHQVVDAANELAPDAHVGLIAFADNHLLDDTGDLEGGRVHTQSSTLVSAFRHIESTYTNANRNPGAGPGRIPSARRTRSTHCTPLPPTSPGATTPPASSSWPPTTPSSSGRTTTATATATATRPPPISRAKATTRPPGRYRRRPPR